MEDNAQFDAMREKVSEELSELNSAIDGFQQVGNAAFEPVIGKAREHVLEEGIDVMTAVYTTMRLLATDEEIQREANKVIIKNDLRGYTKKSEPSDEVIPF